MIHWEDTADVEGLILILEYSFLVPTQSLNLLLNKIDRYKLDIASIQVFSQELPCWGFVEDLIISQFLSVHAPTEDTNIEEQDDLYDLLEAELDSLPRLCYIQKSKNC